ncbi:hypothetical protein, partial [Escherichia coli]|uniref:hypothetical protein n=1 Tax=Escherichia coli TaxID=562 RepID=UPI003CFF88EA
YGIYDNTFMSMLCNAVAICANGQTCTPFSVFSAEIVPNSPADNLMDIIFTYANSGVGVFGVSIRYQRIDIPNIPAFYIEPTIGSSPYTIA